MRRLAAWLVLLAPVPAVAGVSFDGLIDLGLAADLGRSQPTGKLTLFTAYPLDREPSINLVALGTTLEWRGLRARLLLGAGAGLDALHGTDPSRPPGWAGWSRLVEAYAGYTIPVGRGLTVEAGLMPSHIGFEAYLTKDNFNATHGFLAELSPYYQVGARLTYPFTERLSARLLWLNGWNLVDQDAGFRSGGVQLAWSSPVVQLSFSGFFGPARFRPGGVLDERSWRFFGDLWALVRPLPSLEAAVIADGGVDTRPDGGGVDGWYGLGAYLRYRFTSWLAVTLRAEVYDDGAAGLLTGTRQLLQEATLTTEVTWQRITLRVEGRVDRSDAAVFAGRSGRELLVLALLGTF